jgi:hypothetical protein
MMNNDADPQLVMLTRAEAQLVMLKLNLKH